jgi:hypothetical protein
MTCMIVVVGSILPVSFVFYNSQDVLGELIKFEDQIPHADVLLALGYVGLNVKKDEATHRDVSLAFAESMGE